MEKIYDLVIIGSGPAGLSAGLYGARAKLETLILEKGKTGGQIITTHDVANYPGSVEETSGSKLIQRMVSQCREFGAEILNDNIVDVNLEGEIKNIIGEKLTYKAKTIIIATGSKSKKLGIEGEDKLIGKGISYCATCDGDFFTDLEVFVVGGGNSAIEEGLFLTKFARNVTIIHRKDKLNCAKSIEQRARNNSKINFKFNTKVKEVHGDGILEKIVFEDTESNKVYEYKADEEDGTMGLFVFIGMNPQTDIFKDKIKMNNNGYIITDENMKTSVEGVFAAGDCRQKYLRQVVTATNDGAIATVNAEKYIENNFLQ